MFIGCNCGKGIKIPLKTARKLLIEEAEQFCSASCLLSYIKEFDARSANYLPLRSAVLPQTGEVWDDHHQMFFRSQFEVDVAKFLTEAKIVWEYEKHTLILGNQRYTPDFYLTDKALMLEVKGRWLGGGKKKFRKAVKKGYPLLLIPEHIIKDIRKCVSSTPKTNVNKVLSTP